MMMMMLLAVVRQWAATLVDQNLPQIGLTGLLQNPFVWKICLFQTNSGEVSFRIAGGGIANTMIFLVLIRWLAAQYFVCSLQFFYRTCIVRVRNSLPNTVDFNPIAAFKCTIKCVNFSSHLRFSCH